MAKRIAISKRIESKRSRFKDNDDDLTFARACSFLPQRTLDSILAQSVVQGNPLVFVTQAVKYRVRLYDAPHQRIVCPPPSIWKHWGKQAKGMVKPLKHKSTEDIELDNYELEFMCNLGGRWQIVARSPQEFFDFLIGKAAARGVEGFVVRADPSIFEARPVVIDRYGVRDQCAVKVKQEFTVYLLALKVLDVVKKKVLIFTYCTDTDENIGFQARRSPTI
jgi:hypothetical protein